MFPIIFLWAHPRSMSTAVERVMRERGDLHCLHEPFLHYYYLERSGKTLAHFELEADHPVSYEATRDSILAQAESHSVFVKDMSYYVMPELLDDIQFCRRISHSFLIRNPINSMLSYYRLDPAFSLEEVGISAQWQMFEGLQSLGVEPRAVLEAEALQADTPGVMARFCASLNLDFKVSALQWEQSTTPEDWQYVKGWHQKVSESCGIQAASFDLEKARAEFDQLAIQVPKLREYLEFHTRAYEKLKAFSISA